MSLLRIATPGSSPRARARRHRRGRPVRTRRAARPRPAARAARSSSGSRAAGTAAMPRGYSRSRAGRRERPAGTSGRGMATPAGSRRRPRSRAHPLRRARRATASPRRRRAPGRRRAGIRPPRLSPEDHQRREPRVDERRHVHLQQGQDPRNALLRGVLRDTGAEGCVGVRCAGRAAAGTTATLLPPGCRRSTRAGASAAHRARRAGA